MKKKEELNSELIMFAVNKITADTDALTDLMLLLGHQNEASVVLFAVSALRARYHNDPALKEAFDKAMVEITPFLIAPAIACGRFVKEKEVKKATNTN